MTDLPVSTKIAPRPVLARYFARRDGTIDGTPLWPPTNAEKQDAIRVMEEFSDDDSMLWLYQEAERIFCEASS